MKTEKVVYLVQHSRTTNETEEVKVIGVYDSSQTAHLAVERLKQKPGFVVSPNGFSVDEYPLNKDFWSEGFESQSYVQSWNFSD